MGRSRRGMCSAGCSKPRGCRSDVAGLSWRRRGCRPTPRVDLRDTADAMTGKADFTDEEWDLILEAPPSAGLLVITADRGGSVRESFSMAKAYAEARQQHGES